MVEGSSGDGGHDPGLVQLPVGVGVDGNGDGLLGDRRGEGSLGVGDVGVGDPLGPVNGRERLARRGAAVARSIRVRVLSGKTVRGDVLEGVVHQASVATLVGLGVARYELLLREGDLLAILEEVSSLHSTGSGEGPARPARALVLDGGNRVGGGPVDRVGGSDTLESVDHTGSLNSGDRDGEVEGLEFFEGEVRELVVAKGEGVVLRVVGSNDVVVRGEDGKAGPELGGRSELKPVGLDVGDEL